MDETVDELVVEVLTCEVVVSEEVVTVLEPCEVEVEVTQFTTKFAVGLPAPRVLKLVSTCG